ncbi:F0F1 ATP synthase subunit A [Mycoplasma leonicaptivi]|uniref:F0F1 ATP synthase subunit A n=1 Tax=Mycoplasma leonicaptivi TaxID=36742 RepID=UPI000484253D|nr:F0F1 ATP synthase subunit A [Mycoplasma leonicaptivi]
MSESNNLFKWNHTQLVSIILTVFIIIVFSIFIYLKVRKTKVEKASNGIVLIAEMYVGTFEKLHTDVAGETLPQIKPYIITLFTFLLVGNGVAIFGLEPVVTSYSVPFILALFTWVGIFVIGVIFQKIKFLLKNILIPTELIGKLSIILSLSFRIYGNVLGGSIILGLIYTLSHMLGSLIAGNIAYSQPVFAFIGLLITPFLHFYFDLFGSLLQAFIFTLLTLVYWTSEASEAKEKSSHKKSIFKTWTKKNVHSIY